MADFHFLRPWWLLALPFGILLILGIAKAGASSGGWRNVVDAPLQPFVLSGPTVFGERPWPLLAALAAWVLATLALAGPAWQRLPVPAFRSNEALVVALDLSRSMDAADLQPSRLARARLKLLSLLERRSGGQTGLIVFSANAFTVTPLTTDTRTISALVSSLSTDIMPSQGSHIEAGLDKAAALLHQAGVTEGEILLITDAIASWDDVQKARALRRDGFRISVLGVGTEDGAPIPERNGGFLTDKSGRVVVPRLDPGGLAKLADSGGGRFARLSADDSDLEALEPQQSAGSVMASEQDDDMHEADVWRDAGRWLMLLLLPLAALGFRRGWLCVWLAWCLLPLPRAQAQTPPPNPGAAVPAAEAPASDETSIWSDAWQSLWQRPDQRGAAAFEDSRPGDAARLFDDPEWRGAAQYRDGDYTASAASLGGIDTANALYNRGNALARAGRLEAAIDAYDRALEHDPDDEDARYNRDLVQRLLDEQKSQQQQQQQQGEDGEQNQQQGGGQSGEQQQSANGGDSGEQQQAQNDASQSSQNGEGTTGDQSGDERQASADSDAQERGEPRDGDDEQPGDEQQQQATNAEPKAAGPQDVEQWASEQAADQWLRRVPQDPGGLLRRKFLYQYQRLGVDQDGNYVWPGDQKEPW